MVWTGVHARGRSAPVRVASERLTTMGRHHRCEGGGGMFERGCAEPTLASDVGASCRGGRRRGSGASANAQEPSVSVTAPRLGARACAGADCQLRSLDVRWDRAMLRRGDRRFTWNGEVVVTPHADSPRTPDAHSGAVERTRFSAGRRRTAARLVERPTACGATVNRQPRQRGPDEGCHVVPTIRRAQHVET